MGPQEEGSARVVGDGTVASTAEAWLCRGYADEHRSCESECRACGETKSVSGAATLSLALSESSSGMVPEGPSRGL